MICGVPLRLLSPTRRRLDVFFPHSDPHMDFKLRHLPRAVDEAHLLLPGRYRIKHSWGGAQRPTSHLGSPVSASLPSLQIDKHAARYYLWEAVREITHSQLPYQDYVAIVHAGGVRVNGIPVHPDDAHMPVRYKDRIELDFSIPIDYRRVHLPPSTILEDGPHYCIASKPFGIPLGTARRRDLNHDVNDFRETLVHQVRDLLCAQRREDWIRCRTRAIMRKSESGLVLFSRSRQFWEAADVAAEYIRTLVHSYLVIAECTNPAGNWPFGSEDEVDLSDRFTSVVVPESDGHVPQNPFDVSANRFRFVPNPNGEPCITTVRRINSFGRLFLLSVTPRAWALQGNAGQHVWRRQLALHGIPVWNSEESLIAGKRLLRFDRAPSQTQSMPLNGEIETADVEGGSPEHPRVADEVLPYYERQIQTYSLPDVREYVHLYRIKWAPIGAISGRDVSQGPPSDWSV